MLETSRRVFTLWCQIHSSKDLPGQWTAHCLDLDVVTYGDTAEIAMRHLREACESTILDDLNSGLDPADRSAPDVYWTKLWATLGRSKPMSGDEFKALVERNPTRCVVVAQLTMSFSRADHQPIHMAALTTPAAWAEPAYC